MDIVVLPSLSTLYSLLDYFLFSFFLSTYPTYPLSIYSFLSSTVTLLTRFLVANFVQTKKLFFFSYNYEKNNNNKYNIMNIVYTQAFRAMFFSRYYFLFFPSHSDFYSVLFKFHSLRISIFKVSSSVGVSVSCISRA